jgi:hypothetical protein
MPIYVELQTDIGEGYLAPGSGQSSEWQSDHVPVVRPGIPEVDNCPVLTRIKAYLVTQGVPAVLEHVLRARNGRPVDLSALFQETGTSVSSSLSSSLSTSSSAVLPAGGSVVVRVKEWLGCGQSQAKNPVWELAGECPGPSAGVLRVSLPPSVVEHSGIYELSWGVKDPAGILVQVNDGILSVEKSLFPQDVQTLYKDLGPPTINEVRMAIMDSAPSENILLDDVEFGDEQLLLAMIEPVRAWNETPPPIRTFTTRTFPFRGAWRQGVVAQLHLMAANHYKRNRLAHQAGGVAVDDKNKFKEYREEGERLWQQYTDWLRQKKISINLKLFVGSVGSPYGSYSGW